MHSAAIFLGFLTFAWGVGSLRLALLIIANPNNGYGPMESSFDRWMLRFFAALTLPLPTVLTWGAPWSVGGSLAAHATTTNRILPAPFFFVKMSNEFLGGPDRYVAAPYCSTGLG